MSGLKGAKGYVVVGVLIGLLIASFLTITHAADSDMENVTSNVTINKRVAIGLSAQLTNGISFGSLDPQTVDSADPDNGANDAITADSGNNVGVDLCIKANANLSKTAAVTIPMMNYTWWNNDTAGVLNNQTTLNASNQKGFYTNVVAGSVSYWGFWIDIPGGQTAGTYNNSVVFTAVETGVACP